MIALKDSIEMKGSIKTIGLDNIDVEISEIFLDGKWEQFLVPKVYNILIADFDTSKLSESELALFKKMLTLYGKSTALTPDEIAVATSAGSKLV